jgi:hypothetical protein
VPVEMQTFLMIIVIDVWSRMTNDQFLNL